MTTRWRGGAAALTLALGVAGTVAAPVGAEVASVEDPRGDGASTDGRVGDIGRVRVAHRERSVRLVVRPAEGGSRAHFYDFWVDTDAGDPGPEYVATVSLEVLPRTGVATTERFGDLDSGEPTCRVRTARMRGATVRVSYPRTCFDRSQRLRVSVQSSQEHRSADWAPKRHRFGPWVARD